MNTDPSSGKEIPIDMEKLLKRLGEDYEDLIRNIDQLAVLCRQHNLSKLLIEIADYIENIVNECKFNNVATISFQDFIDSNCIRIDLVEENLEKINSIIEKNLKICRNFIQKPTDFQTQMLPGKEFDAIILSYQLILKHVKLIKICFLSFSKSLMQYYKISKKERISKIENLDYFDIALKILLIWWDKTELEIKLQNSYVTQSDLDELQQIFEN